MKVPTDGKAKTILFPTIVDDIHATAVELALREMGHRPVRWLTSNLPERAKCHINFNEEGLNGLAISDYFGEVKLADIDVFWNRRIGAPVITTRLDESDGKVVKIETERFLANMLLCVSESCFSVNDYYAAKRAENKAVQLWKAKSVGLSIPSTIITNSPERIRSFIGQHSPGEVVVKPFMPAMWQTDHDVAIAFTATVTTEQLPPDGILQVAPAIYQRRVEKAYELRVTCMGQHALAARLDSQSVDGAENDWRSVAPRDLKIVPVMLPIEIERKCFALMEELGIVFGSFDFIVTKTGDYVFLEVNQMGQFLWIEEANPEIPMLQSFCAFLGGASRKFQGAPAVGCPSFAAVRSEALKCYKQDLKTHLVAENLAYVYSEGQPAPRSAASV